MVDLSKLEPIKTARDVIDQVDLDHARAYLKETDWHSFAFLEDGTPIPEDVRFARTAARATINRLSQAKPD